MTATTKFCISCGVLANTVHLIKPKSSGGTDNPRNTCLLCRNCHNVAEEIQERTGRELSPELISEVRKKLKIKLAENKEGISECYKVDTQEDRSIVEVLLWIMMPSGTKRYINQKVSILGEEEPRENLAVPEVEPGRPRGRPSVEVNPALLRILVEEKGWSHRKASLALERSGVKVSHATITRRLKALEEAHIA